MSQDPAQRDSAPEHTSAQREYQRYAATDGGEPPATEEPDVLLDVPQLEVDRINLEVESLRAHVSVLAELSNLVHLSVGADVRLDRVKLEIEGVDAQALLKVRLEQVRAILEKALDTIAENPQILESLTQTVDRTAEQVGGAAQEAVGEDGAVSQMAGDVGDATQQVGEATGRVTEEAPGAAVGQVAGQVGQSAQEAPEEAQEGEVKATPSAERLAQELGVDLSQVEGSGAGGRITVRDVRSAAQEEG
jgi:pyruvate/2-oxoglutarate dehydrogenase complex dihydrolipoamide acyltransferase (E2) component